MSVVRKIVSDIDCLISEPSAADDATETIICLHGIGGDDASFAPQSEGLTNQYRVIACNMPGYRQSTPLSSYSFKALVDNLAQFIAALNVGTVHIAGQSIGGMIAQEYFHRYKENFDSGKIKSLILVATTSAFGGRDDSFKEAFLKARLDPLDHGESMLQIAEAAMPSIVGKNTVPEVIDSAIRSMAALDAEIYRQVLGCLITFDRRVQWQTINCPICLVAGSEDTNAPAASMEKMAHKLPHAKFHQIQGAGHLVNLERGEEFNIIVQTFLSHLSGAEHATGASS